MRTVKQRTGGRWTRALDMRIVAGPGKHIRAFADETVMFVSCLVVFADMILEPLGIMQEHVLCLRFLYTIQTMLFMGDKALSSIPCLDNISTQTQTPKPTESTQTHTHTDCRHSLARIKHMSSSTHTNAHKCMDGRGKHRQHAENTC